jgi:membrane protease YdiL (CAAX protease family)
MPDEKSVAPQPPEPPPLSAPSRPPRQRPGIVEIFTNSREPRAGWRLLIYLGIAIGLFIGLRVLLATFFRSHSGFESQFVSEVLGFASAFGAALLMSLIEHRSIDFYGLPVSRAFGKMFWIGWLAGLLEISLLIGSIAAFGGYSFGSLALHGSELFRWAALWALCMLFVGLFEEFLFRGYALFTLTTGIGFWPAAVVLSVFFGAVHMQNPGESSIGVAAVVLVGLFLCFTIRRTGSLWFAVGLHAAFDFGETFLYSVPDSGVLLPGHISNATLHGQAWLTGGSVGPEASVFDFIILLTFFYGIHRLFPAGKSPDQAAVLHRTSSEANTNFTP